jgi:hypothetical protein
LIDLVGADPISGGATLAGPFNWAAVVDQYFAAVFLPEDVQNAAMVTLRHQVDVPKDPRDPKPGETVKAEVLGVGVGNLRGATVERLYVGPKSLGVLESVPVPTLNGVAGTRPPRTAQLNAARSNARSRFAPIRGRWLLKASIMSRNVSVSGRPPRIATALTQLRAASTV